MDNVFLYLIVIIFLVNISIAFIPYWTRETENFGVSIPDSLYFRQDFEAMRKKYTLILIIINIVLFGLLMGVSFQYDEEIVIKLFTAMTIIYILVSFLLYLPFHFKMKNIKKVESWQDELKQTLVIDTRFREEKITYSYSWFLIPAFITIATI